MLRRDAAGEFNLVRFAQVVDQVEAQRIELSDWSIEVDESGSIQLSGLDLPAGHRYLIIRRGETAGLDVHLPVELPVIAHSVAGSVFGRINAHWSLVDTNADNATARIGGITSAGSHRTDFKAIENSFRLGAPERKAATAAR